MMNNKENILVVDDDVDIAAMLKMMLEYKCYDVVTVNRADKVEESLAQNSIDLIILDMLIAGTNGTDTCRNLKRNEAYRHIPVLMISALPDAKQACLDAGANDFLSKPFEMEAILQKVSQLMIGAQKI